MNEQVSWWIAGYCPLLSWFLIVVAAVRELVNQFVLVSIKHGETGKTIKSIYLYKAIQKDLDEKY